MRPVRPALRTGWLLLAALLVLSACATGHDAVQQGANAQFVAPGGQTTPFYEQNKRGRVPTVSGESLTEQGKQLALSDYPGKIVVLNIWGSWCGPCRTEVPELQRVYDATKNTTQVLGIDVQDSVRSAPTDFVQSMGLTYPSIYDPSSRSLLALSGYPRSVVPSTFVFDRAHRVAAVFIGPVSESALLSVVQCLAAEPT
jgi:thiol-disulfide isomerase/thioredoxin